MTDAVVKINHHARCGVACRTHAPLLRVFFADVDDTIASRFATGQLTLAGSMAMGPGASVASSGIQAAEQFSDDERPATCRASLSCARPDAKSAKGVLDLYGIVGGTCPHTSPLSGTFMDMRTPEQFSYYLIMLAWLASVTPQLQDVYIDFGCRLSKTWARFVQRFPGIPGAEQLRIMVNWMHAQGHEEACEVVNSARHHLLAARRVGENAEQLWSMLKVRVMPHALLVVDWAWMSV